MSGSPKVVSIHRSSAYVHHRAMVNRRENNQVDALELMRHAVERAPENQEYKLDLAELYCEMGCHEQSSRLLLDMLAQDNAPTECYYGLALNQLGMNDLAGARQSLRLYRQTEPDGAHAAEVSRLASELDIYEALNRPVSRKLFRAMKIADRACTALQSGDADRAIRLFQQSLSLYSEQYEMRAMYAMALLMNGDDVRAKEEAQRAVECYPPSVRAFCVAAQVFAALDEQDRAKELLRKVIEERPDGVELRLLIFALGEVGMHEEISECVRLALQETPYDRHLLHIRAAALHFLGTSDEKVQRFWQRILRIDPDDSVAQFYLNACVRGELSQNAPNYTYQVPEEECRRRTVWLAEHFGKGLSAAQAQWSENAEFRQIVRWAALGDDEKLRRAAVTMIAALDDDDAASSIRALMFGGELQPELKHHASMLLKLRGADMKRLFPVNQVIDNAVLPQADALLNEIAVGDRQLIRYTTEVLDAEYGLAVESELVLLWSAYRSKRGTHADPLTSTEAAAAALAYNYLLMHGQKPSIRRLAGQFNCQPRRLVFYACRIAEILERSEGET